MSRIVKIGLYVLAGVLLIVLSLVIYLNTAFPAVGPAPEMTIEGTPERIERGEYLANHVMSCTDCHSERKWTEYAGPVDAHHLGMGGEVFDQNMGLPGRYVSSNLTPANLGDWTDGEIFRAITSGVGKDGRALFPIMPYQSYGQIDQEDIKSVIAYLRTLQPIENATDPSASDFPMSMIIKTMPTEPQFTDRPDPSDRVSYGEYLVTAGACADCHTAQEGGSIVGEPFAGGMRFPMPNNTVVVSANITPHANGIGGWSEQQFVERFKMYADSAYVSPTIGDGDAQTIMPWMMYSGMTEEDLGAIYSYLKTIEPAEARIESFQAAL